MKTKTKLRKLFQQREKLNQDIQNTIALINAESGISEDTAESMRNFLAQSMFHSLDDEPLDFIENEVTYAYSEYTYEDLLSDLNCMVDDIEDTEDEAATLVVRAQAEIAAHKLITGE